MFVQKLFWQTALHYDDLMDESNLSPQNINSRLEEGVALVNSGEAESAKAILDEVVAQDPNCAKAVCGRGTAHRLLGHYEEAIQDYDAALLLEPNYPRALFNRGLTRFAMEDYEPAFAEMDKAILQEPEPGFYYHRATCYAHLKNFDAALSDLDRAGELDSDGPAEVYFQRGIVFSQLGKHKEAIADIEEAIRRNPKDPQFYDWLAFEHVTLKKYERATKVLDEAIALNGNLPLLLFRRGSALYYVRDYESAIQDFDKAIHLDEDNVEVVYWRGCAFERLGDFDAAIADFSAAIDKDRHYFPAYRARGEAYLDIDDIDHAIKDLAFAIELNPEKASPFVLRGKAWLEKGNDQLAMEDFNSALKINPRHKKALQARSQLFTEQGELKQAELDLDTLEDVLIESLKGKSMSQRRTRISLLLSEHFEPMPVSDLAITERQFPFRVRADLQYAVDQLFAEAKHVDRFSGVKKEHSYEGVSFSDLLFPTSHSPALAVPPEYEEVDVGENEPVRCLKNGLWLLQDEDLKYAVFLGPTKEHGRSTGMQFQVAVPRGEAGAKLTQEFFAHLEKAVIESKSYRGKILSLELQDRYTGMSSGILVHKLRTVDREQVILPSATLELLDRNIIQFAQQREKLCELGLSTKKGLLFYGPPGTGKTHTIHYLAGAMEGHTTLLITAEQVGLLSEYMTLARLLQPSIVVIEDADLIARERSSMESACEEVLLNKLLNEMDGLRPNTDVFFVLTTNRPEALEAALASRPGRIDQAIEFPLPDEEGREKLVKLYSNGMEVPESVIAATVKRTDRVSASFIKELMRRAAQFHLERNGTGSLNEADVDSALEELLFAGGSLNCSLLGMQRDAD